MAWPIANDGPGMVARFVPASALLLTCIPPPSPPNMWSRNARQEKLCSCPRKHIGKPRKIAIFLNKDTTSPALLATVQPYMSNDDQGEAANPSKADFPRDHVPSYEALQSWVESQIRREQGPDFSQTLQSFLLAYAEGGRALPKIRIRMAFSSRLAAGLTADQHNLVQNVFKMSCFFMIWRMPSFWCRDPTNRIANLPLSVQARLRNIAREALKSLEYKVLKSLDECLGQHSQPRPDEKMAVWASLWQLILMYRDLLTACKAKVARLTREGDEDVHDGRWTDKERRGKARLTASTVNAYIDHYRQLADTYFPLVAVFYHYQFRTKSLDLSLDWLEAGQAPGQALKKRAEIRLLGQRLLDARKEMCECSLETPHPCLPYPS